MTIRIETRFYAFLKERVGKDSAEMYLNEGATPKDFIHALIKQHGEIASYLLDEDGGLRSNIAIAINGVKISREEVHNRRLKDGDVVVIIPPISGG